MATPVQADDPLVGRVLDQRYRLTSLLARGGMGTVYRAVDERLDRPVAVKVMHTSLAADPEFVERFTREARSAARLSAPEVVAVFDQGHDAGTGAAYLVMEHVEGRDLRALLRERGALPADRALSLLEPVLRALAAAHRAGIVHRDVKPENVLLGDDGRVKVADFGLARAVETSALTATRGMVLGSVAYLAPEQIDSGRTDPRTDVYAAGIVLWEALTGTPPFSADSAVQVLFRHVNEDVPPPSTVVPDLPAALDDLVVRATRRDPSQRPVDAGAFLAEVRLLREDLGALPGGPPERLAAPGPAAPVAPRSDTLVVPLPVDLRTDEPARPAPDAAPGRPVPRRRRLLVLVALVLLGALAVGGGWYLGAGRFTRAPAVLALSQADAEQRLRVAGLSAALQEPRFDETVPAGAVLDQSPDPGDRVRKDGTVRLVLSKGPDRRTVPVAVVGATRDAAAGLLQEVGLDVGEVTSEFSSTGAAGTVLRTDPAAGAPLRPGALVGLVLSKGPEPLPVPDVTGQPRAAAEAAVARAGFTSTVVLAFDEQVPSGSVVRQSPSGGTAGRGSAVTLTVSKGPDLQTVPDLVGLDRDTAVAELEALGVKARVVSIPGPGRVRSVSPGAGEQVRKGSTVTLYVF